MAALKIMAAYIAWFLLMVGYICTASGFQSAGSKNSTRITTPNTQDEETTDLKLAASTYYSSGLGSYAHSDYGVTGHGILDDRKFHAPNVYNNYNGYNRYDGNYEKYSGTFDGYRGNLGHAGYSGYTNDLVYKPFASNVGPLAHSGNGGYGGYGGNGGLGSYLGYNNPYYQGANHLGYGYYNKPGLNSIYNNGITPSLVTGYRGYSRK